MASLAIGNTWTWDLEVRRTPPLLPHPTPHHPGGGGDGGHEEGLCETLNPYEPLLPRCPDAAGALAPRISPGISLDGETATDRCALVGGSLPLAGPPRGP